VNPCAPAAGDDENGDGDVNWKGEPGDLAIALRAEGLSATVIALRVSAAFDVDITRNAVLGFLHRKGLCIKSSGRKGTGTAGGLSRAFKSRQEQRRKIIRAPMEAMPLPQADDLARVTFADLEDNHCRFIVGDPSQLRGAPMFCGLPKHPGLSYCTGHAARCVPGLFIEPQTRAETPVERETELV
jgi:hypothetical protein